MTKYLINISFLIENASIVLGVIVPISVLETDKSALQQSDCRHRHSINKTMCHGSCRLIFSDGLAIDFVSTAYRAVVSKQYLPTWDPSYELDFVVVQDNSACVHTYQFRCYAICSSYHTIRVKGVHTKF